MIQGISLFDASVKFCTGKKIKVKIKITPQTKLAPFFSFYFGLVIYLSK